MNNERVLFIGTEFYDYHLKIKDEIERLGYLVDFYGDRPNTTSITRAMLKINPGLIKRRISDYYKQILEETRDNTYKYVFILNGKSFTREMIAGLKELHNYSEFVLYLWDSVELYPNVKEFLHLFDRCYTFDYKDSEQVENLILLPLFYSDDYAQIPYLSNKNEYDLVSICTAHPNRYRIINKLFPILEKQGLRIYSFYFIIKLQYIYNKIFISDFRHAKKEEFNFRSLSNHEVIDIISKSKSVFDIPHAKQTGLTMRTVETIGAKKKLITTNNYVEKYSFYNENNIFVLDDDNYKGIIEFLDKPYKELDQEVYESYSLGFWVRRILNNENTIDYLR